MTDWFIPKCMIAPSIAKQVYLCLEGDSQDSTIVAIFEDKILAEKFCRKFSDCSIIEKRLNPFSDQLLNDCLPYFIRLSKDGILMDINTEPSCYGFGIGNNHGFDRDGNMYFYCMAKSREHAIEIANTHRINILNQWGSSDV